MSTMELSKDTARVLALKRQLEELAGGITAYVEERLAVSRRMLRKGWRMRTR